MHGVHALTLPQARMASWRQNVRHEKGRPHPVSLRTSEHRSPRHFNTAQHTPQHTPSVVLVPDPPFAIHGTALAPRSSIFSRYIPSIRLLMCCFVPFVPHVDMHHVLHHIRAHFDCAASRPTPYGISHAPLPAPSPPRLLTHHQNSYRVRAALCAVYRSVNNRHAAARPRLCHGHRPRPRQRPVRGRARGLRPRGIATSLARGGRPHHA